MVVSLHQGRKGSLPPCKAAAILGSPVEGESPGGSRCGERSAVTASQLLPRNVHLEPVGEILVVVGSVSGPVGIGGTGTTLQGSIDDHGGCSKAGFEPGTSVN